MGGRVANGGKAATVVTAHLVLLLLSGGAARATTGAEIVAKMDAAMTRADDQMFEYQVIDHKPGEEDRQIAFRVHIKGERRLSEFFTPANLKGTKALVLHRTQMYVYLPAYRKVRRVASHTTAGGFLGTSLSHEMMSTVTYGEAWRGELTGETDAGWSVTATPREGTESNYAKLEFEIDKGHLQPTAIRYFDRQGAVVATETREDYSCQGDICNARVMTVTDHGTKGWTKLVRRTWKVNTGLTDRFFSVRNIQK